MDQVKIVGLGAPSVPYGGRPNPQGGGPIPGPQVAHQQSSRKYRELEKRSLDSSSYKNATVTISPPMVRTPNNNGGIPAPGPQPAPGATPSMGGHYANSVAYPPPSITGAGDSRYIEQTLLTTPYGRQDHYQRSLSRRPTIMGHYGSYGSRPGDLMHIMPVPGGVGVASAASGGTIAVTTKVDNSKRIKLTPTQVVKQDMRLTGLHVDTDSQNNRDSSYYPQVEAISPTPTDSREDTSVDKDQADILAQIAVLDKDIAKYDESVKKLKEKETKILAAAEQVQKDGDKGGDCVDKEQEETSKHQTLAHAIYVTNKRIADTAHREFFSNTKNTNAFNFLPLYQQPSDNNIYVVNRDKFYGGFKSRLMAKLKKDVTTKIHRIEKTTTTYSKLRSDWIRKVERMENCKRHRERIAKCRELFEKVFNELRKQREDKERFSRVGARVKSDAEMEEIMDGLQEQENEEKKMRSYAVIPPIMLDNVRRSYKFDNNNGLIEDPITELKERKNLNIWSEHEKDIFRDKYLQHPKNFVLIASYLDKKTVSDCIKYYYSSKKTENYKTQVKKRIRRPRPQKGANNSNSNNNNQNSDSIMNSSGVTTRQSVAALQQKETTSNRNSPISESNSPQTNNIVSSEDNSVTSSSSTMVVSSATSSTLTVTSSTVVTSVSASPAKQEFNRTSHPASAPKETSTMATVESSEEEPMETNETGGAHKCCACNTLINDYSGSQRVSNSQLPLYGINPATLSSDPSSRRVCNVCRVRVDTFRHNHTSRPYPQCPVGTCQTPKWKVRKLRSLPSRWHQLPSDVTDPIIREMQLPTSVSKCCSKCLQRIHQLLGPSASEPPFDPSLWSQHEVHILRESLQQFGRHWSRISASLPSKNESECKSYFYHFRSNPNYKLEEAISQYKLSRGKAANASSSESGSSTESCDEQQTLAYAKRANQTHRDSTSDTASASSPLPGRLDGVKEEAMNYENSANGRESPEVQHIPHPNESIPHKIPVSLSGVSIHPVLPHQNKPASSVRDIIAKCIENNLTDPPAKPHMQQHFVNPQQPPAQSAGHDQHPPPSHIGPNSYPPYGPHYPPWVGSGTNTPPVISDPRSGIPPPRPSYQENIGLDLSVKKRERNSPPSISHPAFAGGRDPHTLTVQGGAEIILAPSKGEHRGTPPRAHNTPAHYTKPPYPHYESEAARKAPSPYATASLISGTSQRSTAASPRLIYPPSGAQMRNQQPLPPKGSPQLSSNRLVNSQSGHMSVSHTPATVSRIPLKAEKSAGIHGSITHGTPVNSSSIHASNNAGTSQPARYEMISKTVVGREGSITQGTPVHHEVKRPGLPMKDGIPYEPRAGMQIIPRSSANYDRDVYARLPKHPSTVPSSTYYNSSFYTRPSYTGSSHLEETKTILENDFHTSQQMTRGRPVVSEKEIRGSPRPSPRDMSPHGDPRDHRAALASQMDRRDINQAMVNSRVIDPRTLDPRDMHRPAPVDHRVLDQRRIDHRPSDPRNIDHRGVIDPRSVNSHHSSGSKYRPEHPVVEIHSADMSRHQADPRAPYSYPPHSQTYYINSDGNPSGRPSVSPATIRGETTPTPPNLDGNHADYHPSNRVRSVISRPAMPKPAPPPTSHFNVGAPKSASPRTISTGDRYSPRHHNDNLHNLAEAASKRDQVSLAVEVRRGQHHQTNSVSILSPHELQQRAAQQQHDLQQRAVIAAQHEMQQQRNHEIQQHRAQEIQRAHQHHEQQQAAAAAAAHRHKFDSRVVQQQYERVMKNNMTKKDEHDENASNGKHHMGSDGDMSTIKVGSFINNIITRQIKGHDDNIPFSLSIPPNPASVNRMIQNCQQPEKRMQNNSKIHMNHNKGKPSHHENEIVTVDDGPSDHRTTPSSQHQQQHPKSIQAHVENLINREFTMHESAKKDMRRTDTRPSLEVIRSESNKSGGGGHHQGFDQWKQRAPPPPSHPNNIKQNSTAEVSLVSTQYHTTLAQLPPKTSSSLHNSSPHMSVDERQIIRIAQASRESPHGMNKGRTPPTSSGVNSEGNPILSFDYVKQKLAQCMRDDKEEGAAEGTLHPHHYDPHDEKRKDSRPPSRPRSGPPNSLPPPKTDGRPEEGADSPHSGEMVIDETPSQQSSVSPVTNADKHKQYAAHYSQYSYNRHRHQPQASHHSSPHTTSWASANTTSTPPQPRPNSNYEPSVEPVSDDE